MKNVVEFCSGHVEDNWEFLPLVDLGDVVDYALLCAEVLEGNNACPTTDCPCEHHIQLKSYYRKPAVRSFIWWLDNHVGTSEISKLEKLNEDNVK